MRATSWLSTWTQLNTAGTLSAVCDGRAGPESVGPLENNYKISGDGVATSDTPFCQRVNRFITVALSAYLPPLRRCDSPSATTPVMR